MKISTKNWNQSHSDHEILLNNQISIEFLIVQYCPENYSWLNIRCMHLLKVSYYHLPQVEKEYIYL